jgi:hypothetical protein
MTFYKKIFFFLFCTGATLLFYSTYALLLLRYYPIQKYGWNPYIFGGMPEFTTGVSGIKYYNLIWLTFSFAENLFCNLIHLNPLTYLSICLMFLTFYYIKNKKITSVISVLLFELLILSMVV